MEPNQIDLLVDQIDNDYDRTCDKCIYQTKFLNKVSCNHFICLGCSEELTNSNKYTTCPVCQSDLKEDLKAIFSRAMKNLITKLDYCYQMQVEDILWYYCGNSHNWLFSRNHCEILNNAFIEYAKDKQKTTVEIQLETLSATETVPAGGETYVIDFTSLCQYPKNNPKKKRTVSYFKLKGASDLRKNKIVGIAGKLI